VQGTGLVPEDVPKLTSDIVTKTSSLESRDTHDSHDDHTWKVC